MEGPRSFPPPAERERTRVRLWLEALVFYFYLASVVLMLRTSSKRLEASSQLTMCHQALT